MHPVGSGAGAIVLVSNSGWSGVKHRLFAGFTRRITEEVHPTPPLSVEAFKLLETIHRIGSLLEKVSRSCEASLQENARTSAADLLTLATELNTVVKTDGAPSHARELLNRATELVDSIGQMAAEHDWNDLGDDLFDEYYQRNSVVQSGIRSGRKFDPRP